MKLTTTLILALLAWNIAWAEVKVEPIYVVDIQKVIDESIVGKAAKKNVELEAKKSQSKLNLLKNELQRMDEDLKKQAGILSAEALEQKQQVAMRKEQELGAALQEQRAEFIKKNDAEIQRIVKDIRAIVSALAEKEKYKFVIEKDHRFVLYAGEKHDLTSKVVELLNEKKLNS